MSSKRWIVSLALALALLAAGCGSSSSSSGPHLQPLRIALDYTENVDYLGIYVAEANGYFRAEGIDPVILPYAGAPAETLLAAHKTDLGLTYPPNIPAYRASGLDYEAVAGLSQVNTINIAVLAKSKYTSVAQLSGTLYGGFGVSSDEPILIEVFRKAGVAHPVYREVNLGVDAYVALAAGRVAYSITYGGIDDITAELNGVKLRQWPIKEFLGSAFSFPDDAFVALDSEVKAQPGLLRRGLRALAEGYEYAAAHPAQAEAILLRDNPTALHGATTVIDATGDATAPTFVDKAGVWGQMDDADFAGLTQILVGGGLVPAAKAPSPTADYTDALLPTAPVDP
jgi:ABC-type nitrate/sulfonate/bicarbonate transport system substrate-binding protein